VLWLPVQPMTGTSFAGRGSTVYFDVSTVVGITVTRGLTRRA